MSDLDRTAELSRSLTDVRNRVSAAATKASRKPEDVTLVVVTKTYPVSDVEILHGLGVTDFG